MRKIVKRNLSEKQVIKEENKAIQGYPSYPEVEDIYKKYQEEIEIDPEDVSRNKAPAEKDKTGMGNENKIINDLSGSDLDVPGSELDDEQEEIGSEDEENNYYSLGGDNHDDLEETRNL